ncbi:hypothetical protein [Streptomyces indicus]|uniref:Tetratricopeptide repeat-containing protein n=1 Tax=Streptomyces indicus TaxID=417292 RepID=A0A1G9G0V1_9ACTN|nr:hypothetical protein [Streptomyces indicus]SDK94274.1 hypothetical protein SAMN05421806_114178 [Streptomyces indicus]
MTTAPQSIEALYEALHENDQRPYGRTRTVTAEELADAAEQFDDPALLIDALLELQEAYTYGAEPRKSPVVFARLLNLYDEQPDAFDERMRHQLFWRFKWVANALLALPEIPLATLRQWLGEMRDRYVKADIDLQPYYGQAYQLADHLGEDTALAYELWAGRVRSRYSDCEACEICERALFHVGRGDDPRALGIWEPVLSGQDSCQEEPARSISYALLPLLRTGAADRARELHLAGYRACRRNPSMAPEVGRHLEFCALTGNEARGLELLAENRSLFEEVDSPADQLAFLTGVEVLLQRVEALGHGGLATAGYAGRSWTVASLRTEIRTRADELAARFDARNGTASVSTHRRTRLERAPLLDALELTLRPRALDEMTTAQPAPVVSAPESHPETLAELIIRARELDEEGHPEADTAWERLHALATAPDYRHPDDPAVGPLVRLRAELLEHEAGLAERKEDNATAAALAEEAAGLYEDAGRTGQAVLARARALLAAAEAADGDETAKAEAVAAAHAAICRLHEEASAPGPAAAQLTPHEEAALLRVRAAARGLRLQFTRSQEDVPAAFAELDLLHEFATRHALKGQISGAGLLRASVHAMSGDLPAARAQLDSLLDRLRAGGPAWHLPRTLGLRGRVHLGMRDAEAAHTDLTEAVRLANEWPAARMDRGRLHSDLGEACLHLGLLDEALRHLTRGAEMHLRQGDRVDGFCAYSNAAQLSIDLDRVEDAIALLDSVLAEPDIAGGELDDRLTAQLRLTRARALHAGGDLKAATTEFAALAAESADWSDDPGSHAMIAGETAVLLAEAGEFGPAREALDQALAAHATSPESARYEQLSNHLREVARLQAQQQGEEGLRPARALLAEAERLAAAAARAGFVPQGRSLETALAYEHGRVNAYAGAYEESLTALTQTLTLLGEVGSGDERIGEWTECVRLAGVVEGIYLERTGPALARIDAAVGRLTAIGRPDATTPLTELAAQLRDE